MKNDVSEPRRIGGVGINGVGINENEKEDNLNAMENTGARAEDFFVTLCQTMQILIIQEMKQIVTEFYFIGGAL